MTTTFVAKQIEVSIQLANNPQTNQPAQFAETGGDTLTTSDKRVSVRIQNSGAPSSSAAQVMIFGLSSSVMNQLSTLGMVLNLVPRNTLTIKAGDVGGALSAVFSGTIVNAYADLNAAPDVPFILTCQSGLADATMNVPPTTFNGSTPVSTVMSGLARQMNVGFENNGVDSTLSNPYYRGSLTQQMRQCAKDAGINAEIVNGNVLAIWPKFGSRDTQNIPLIAAPPDGGMIGFPSFTQQGILVRNIFNPNISFGGKVQVQTSEEAVQKANGTWTVYKLDMALDAQLPHGKWEMAAYCYNANSPNPVLPPP
ncbi:hypothetical protein IC762_17820 [Bradyrhizobium genosp. L]|uniref:baseplate hub protein n=1 Tax=Bradyrhizobium genosp. L TaxID=83637 RepID=UPI0018A24F34|nr:hypothetical protein [Bradyrhizobium genosp. L]QPF81681.1 hypothetical protein IC762_17820 [Bradyrhizobium genosp. L]